MYLDRRDDVKSRQTSFSSYAYWMSEGKVDFYTESSLLLVSLGSHLCSAYRIRFAVQFEGATAVRVNAIQMRF